MMNLSKPTAFMLLLLNLQIANGQTLEHTPLLNTIGIKVTNINNFDSCKVAYKQTQGDAWLMAFPPDKIAINNLQQFRGSIFGLEEGTQYDVKITLYTNSNAVTLPVSQTLTLSSPDFNLTENVKWVSPDGNGNFTQNNPGNLHNLFSTNQVACGTTIVLTDGVYTANNLQLTIHNHCTENTPIMMIAAPGATPVIDGGVQVLTPWTQAPGDPNLYSTALPANADHSGICVLDNTMLYPYPSLYSTNLYYNLSDLNFGYDGFARDGNTIWIKTHTGINPNLKSVFVSKSKRFLTIYGNQKNIFLKVKGIEFRHFGKPTLNPIGSSQDAYLATVFDLRNVNHVYFDSCRFKYNTADINFSGGSNHIFIQNSSFKHDAGKWSHAMIKKSNDFNIFVSSSRGRGVETAAIFLEQAKSVVIRNNLFDGLNSAVASYVNYGLNEEVDIYNNIFVDNFDAVECDGQWSNLRVWKNEIIRPMAGISAAPPLIGPRYFYRNVIHGMQGRRNEPN
ncbi:MAG: right-handed parallel beta-helix repeat-containing protein, partial [Saprospiraceae bacterium]